MDLKQGHNHGSCIAIPTTQFWGVASPTQALKARTTPQERDVNWILGVESLRRKPYCIDGPRPCRSEARDRRPSRGLCRVLTTKCTIVEGSRGKRDGAAIASLTCWTRDNDCRGTVAHRAAECRRRGGGGQDRGHPRAVGEGEPSGIRSGLRHPSRRVLGRCCFTGQTGNISRVFFVETPPTLLFIFVSCRLAAGQQHITPKFGALRFEIRTPHRATLSRLMSTEGCIKCIAVSYSLWVPEAESHPRLVMRAIEAIATDSVGGGSLLPEGGVPFHSQVPSI
jgi:hypothetical protein